MKTYPRMRSDGSIQDFDIPNSFWWSLGPMRRVLQSVDGVTNVYHNWFNENRYSFSFLGRRCVVNEPGGLDDHYRITPIEMEPPLDLAPVYDAFRRYRVGYTADPDFNEEIYVERFGRGLAPDVSAVCRYKSARVDLIVWTTILILAALGTDELLRAILHLPKRHGPPDEVTFLTLGIATLCANAYLAVSAAIGTSVGKSLFNLRLVVATDGILARPGLARGLVRSSLQAAPGMGYVMARTGMHDTFAGTCIVSNERSGTESTEQTPESPAHRPVAAWKVALAIPLHLLAGLLSAFFYGVMAAL